MKKFTLQFLIGYFLVALTGLNSAQANSCRTILSSPIKQVLTLKGKVTAKDIEVLLASIKKPVLQAKLSQVIEDVGLSAIYSMKVPKKRNVVGVIFTEAQRQNRLIRNIYWKHLKGLKTLNRNLKQETKRLLMDSALIQSEVFINIGRRAFDEPRVSRYRRFLNIAWGSSMLSRADFNFNLLLFEEYRINGTPGLEAARQEHLFYRTGSLEYLVRAWGALNKATTLPIMIGIPLLFGPDLIYSLHFERQASNNATVTEFSQEASELFNFSEEELITLIQGQNPTDEDTQINLEILKFIIDVSKTNSTEGVE